MSMLNKLENREIIKYLREHGESTADKIPLDLSLRKKSALLKKLSEKGFLVKEWRKGRVWVYSIAWVYKERFDWE